MTSESRRWRTIILGFCGIIALLAVVSIFSVSGLNGAPPWSGHWGFNRGTAPFGFVVTGIDPAGPAARAGVRAGDAVDLRNVPLQERYWINQRALNGRAVTLPIRRQGRLVNITVTPTPIATLGGSNWGQRWILSFGFYSAPLLVIWLTLFAAVIASRGANSQRARLLAFALLAYGAYRSTAPLWTTPWLWENLASDVCARLALPLSAGLAIALASTFGVPLSRLRRILEYGSYALLFIVVGLELAAVLGFITLWFDWNAPIFSALYLISIICALPLLCIAVAIGTSHPAERQRSLWMLVPLGTLFVTGPFIQFLAPAVRSSYFFTNLVADVNIVILLLVPIALTYAVLNHRVLDISFVLNRAAVFAGVSVVLVGTFVLVEWLLTGWLQEASHAANVMVGAALALSLGLSIRYVHARVEHLVDNVFFRKRHEDERALSDFSREAAYFTAADVLLDELMRRIELHTDARSGRLFLNHESMFVTVRALGESHGAVEIDENDSAIVALKTWHKPLDPHQYSTAMRGVLALPMLTRGTLLGVLVLGERLGGEAYAPDEVQVLTDVAQAVGSAFGALSANRNGARASFEETVLERLRIILSALKDPSRPDRPT